MKIFQKIKDLFKKEEKEKPVLAEIPFETQEDKKEVVGTCAICKGNVFSEEPTNNFQGNLVHKRCFRKAKKLAYSGQNPFNIDLSSN